MAPSPQPPHSPEARLIARLARPLLRPAELEAARADGAAGLDPARLLALADRNRLAPLLYRGLREAGLASALPAELLDTLRARLRQEMLRGARLEQATGELLTACHAAGLHVVLLRGLAVGEAVYGDAALRPYSDLDLLLARAELPACLALLRAAGYAAPEGALADGFYARQHLHLAYVQRATGVTVELHWALDHRFAPWRIDYAELLAAARPGTLAGVPAWRLAPEPLLLSLAIHLVKHAPCLERLLDEPRAADRALEAGWWLHLLDVAAAAEHFAATLDWPRLVELARRWNCTAPVRAALRGAVELLDAPVPGELVSRLAGQPPGRLARWVTARQLRALAPSAEAPRGRKAGFRRDVAFRPVRLLELLPYLWPAAEELRACYPRLPARLRRPRHLAGAAGALATGLADLLVSQVTRRRE